MAKFKYPYLVHVEGSDNTICVTLSEVEAPTIRTSNMKNYTVYILRCSDRSYYTGVTNNIARRLSEHENGVNNSCYTYSRRPLALVFQQQFTEIVQAIAFEKQVKGWSRKKKEAIINGHWEQLKGLSACKNTTSHENR